MDPGRARLVVFLAVFSMCALVGCTSRGEVILKPSIAPVSPTSTTSSAAGSPSATPNESQDRLKSGGTKRKIKSGSLSVNIEYSTPLKLSRWTAVVPKPLNVKVSAIVKGREQKVYLQGVTVYATAWDTSDPVDSTGKFEDFAKEAPGYLVTSPDTYNQAFVIPAVDNRATSLRVDMRFEFLLRQGTSNPADYTKRTLIDSLTIPLSSGD